MERHEILERNSVKSSNSLSGNERQYMYVRSQYLWGTWSAMQYNKTIYMYACPQPYDISPPPPFIQVVPLRLHIGRALASVVSRRSDDLYHTNWSILQSSRCRYIAVTWTGDSEKKMKKRDQINIDLQYCLRCWEVEKYVMIDDTTSSAKTMSSSGEAEKPNHH